MKINVYVDGFNLYYGCLKHTPYKWLDLHKLVSLELPNDTIHRIRYFTAQVSARPGDPDQPRRQQAYLDALQTLPRLTVHYGRYLQSKQWMPVVNPPPATVEVWKSEEKGSDVNLACYMLLDAFSNDCESAVVISNDSDLEEPVRLVRKHFRRPVVVLHPCRAPRYPSRNLRVAASLSRVIQVQHLAAAQFPAVLTASDGAVIATKPASW